MNKKGRVEKKIFIYQTSHKLELVTTVQDFAFFKKGGSKCCSWQQPWRLTLAINTFSRVSSFMFERYLFLVLLTMLKILSHSALLWGIVKIDNITFAICLYFKFPSTFLIFPSWLHWLSILSDFFFLLNPPIVSYKTETPMHPLKCQNLHCQILISLLLRTFKILFIFLKNDILLIKN